MYLNSQRVEPLAPVFQLLGNCFPRARYERNSSIAGKGKCYLGLCSKRCVGATWNNAFSKSCMFTGLYLTMVERLMLYLFLVSQVITHNTWTFPTGLELEKRRLKRLDKELEAAQWLGFDAHHWRVGLTGWFSYTHRENGGKNPLGWGPLNNQPHITPYIISGIYWLYPCAIAGTIWSQGWSIYFPTKWGF